MAERVLCDLCGRLIPPHAHYVVRMEVYADPTMPAVDSEELEEKDLQAEWAKLMDELKNYTAEELQDQVHRSFEFKLCRPCQVRFLINPLGKPRQQERPGSN
jgi:hypothetical protein